MDYTSSYPTPDNLSQSFVILSLAIAQSKVYEPALNTLGRLPEKDEESMIKEGLSVLEGKITAETYTNKLFSIFKKIYKDNLCILSKNKEQEEGMRNQVETIIKGNCSTPKNINIKKQMLKESERYTVKYKFYYNDDKNKKIQTVEDVVTAESKKDAEEIVRMRVEQQNKKTVTSVSAKEQVLKEGSFNLDWKRIHSDVLGFRPNGQRFDGDDSEDNEIKIDFHYLGHWVPDEGDEDEEDNDYEIWAPGEHNKYSTMFIDYCKRFSWFSKVKVGVHTEEKNWCSFYVVPKQMIREDSNIDELYQEIKKYSSENNITFKDAMNLLLKKKGLAQNPLEEDSKNKDHVGNINQ